MTTTPRALQALLVNHVCLRLTGIDLIIGTSQYWTIDTLTRYRLCNTPECRNNFLKFLFRRLILRSNAEYLVRILE
jgi:hypothetical protein